MNFESLDKNIIDISTLGTEKVVNQSFPDADPQTKRQYKDLLKNRVFEHVISKIENPSNANIPRESDLTKFGPIFSIDEINHMIANNDQETFTEVLSEIADHHFSHINEGYLPEVDSRTGAAIRKARTYQQSLIDLGLFKIGLSEAQSLLESVSGITPESPESHKLNTNIVIESLRVLSRLAPYTDKHLLISGLYVNGAYSKVDNFGDLILPGNLHLRDSMFKSLRFNSVTFQNSNSNLLFNKSEVTDLRFEGASFDKCQMHKLSFESLTGQETVDWDDDSIPPGCEIPVNYLRARTPSAYLATLGARDKAFKMLPSEFIQHFNFWSNLYFPFK